MRERADREDECELGTEGRRGRGIGGERGDWLASREDFPLLPTGPQEVPAAGKQNEARDEDLRERGQQAERWPDQSKSFIHSHFHTLFTVRRL